METNESATQQVQLTAGDIQVIDQFRRQKSTAVLTILFTDIKGFTKITEEHGEEYSNKLRQHHDALVVPIIERDGGGRVIKHIGDSVMAVFSEPSTAVARSLEVQEKLVQFNHAHPDLEKIEVRIGLHSGQVTTEDDVNGDVFGRHVNRAARVEALADGGQVLVTYSVFDSARGWLNDASKTPVAWEKHGRYALKGIAEPIEIFEAYHPKITKPHAPTGAIKAGWFSWQRITAAAAALIFLAATGTYFFLQFANSRPEITLINYYDYDTKLWDGQPLMVDGENGQHVRHVLTPLKSGHYLAYIETSQIVRSFAPFDIQRGKNLFQMKFKRVELPAISRRVNYSPTGPNTLHDSIDETYLSYDAQKNPHENTAHIDMNIQAVVDPANDKKVKFTCAWVVTLNGKEISRDSVTDENMMDNNDIIRRPQKILWSDGFHYYYLSYYMGGVGAEFTIEANFADYKNR